MALSAQPILVFLLAALAAGGMLWALFQPRLDGGDVASDRFDAIATGDRPAARTGAGNDRGRKQSVEEALREIAEKQSGGHGKKKVSLQLRMRQAGLSWTRKTYYLFCLGAGVLGFLFALAVLGISQLPALGFGVAAALILPNFVVNRKRKKRFAAFIAGLPDALDVIVRGVKSGLPLSDCIKAIAAEADEPIRSEFKAMVDDHTMGLPLDEAAQRLPARIPVPEAGFFAIVIAMQSRSGGSLSEALGNLSKVVRDRKKMKNKIQAMSSEAKTSAGIIAALPFFVAGVLTLGNPDYVSLLFTTFLGNVILAVSGFWMLTGVLVMRKMIAFDF